MIKFLSSRDGRKCLGLVITLENVDLLMKDKPIFIHAEQVNLQLFNVEDIVVMYAENDIAALKLLSNYGTLHEGTLIKAADEN